MFDQEKNVQFLVGRRVLRLLSCELFLPVHCKCRFFALFQEGK